MTRFSYMNRFGVIGDWPMTPNELGITLTRISATVNTVDGWDGSVFVK